MEDILGALETLRAAQNLCDSMPRNSRDRRDIERLIDELAEAVHAALLAEGEPDGLGRLREILRSARTRLPPVTGEHDQAR
jgi:hypothetical protein